MARIGRCVDAKCNDEIKPLYQCHCCSYFICIKHLLQHIKIKNENKQKRNKLRNELKTTIYKLKLIIEEKLLIIKHEQNLIEQAKQYLDVLDTSFEDLQNMLQMINQEIASNCSETVVKVERSLTETQTCSADSQQNKENTNSNNTIELLDTSKDDEYSNDMIHDFVDIPTLHETPISVENPCENEEQQNGISKPCGNITIQCPLTFEGAYGLTKANHSIECCEYGINLQSGLYHHLIKEHKFKEAYAQRLMKAVADNQDPRIVLFDRNECVKDNYEVQCPFFNRKNNSTEYVRQNALIRLCAIESLPIESLQSHLEEYHNIPVAMAEKFVNGFIQDRADNEMDLCAQK